MCMLDGKELRLGLILYLLSDTKKTGDLARHFIGTSCMKLYWVSRISKTLWSTSGRNGPALKVVSDFHTSVVSEN